MRKAIQGKVKGLVPNQFKAMAKKETIEDEVEEDSLVEDEVEEAEAETSDAGEDVLIEEEEDIE